MLKKNFLFLFIIFILGASLAKADSLDSNGIIRKDDGSVRLMNIYQALGIDVVTKKKVGPVVCEQWGLDLPSIRQLAENAKKFGAKEIIDYDNNLPYPKGYFTITASSFLPPLKYDNFHYSPNGYVDPQGDLGTETFWSSSLFSGAPHLAYIFDRTTGRADNTQYFKRIHAVMCLPKP